jgi:hypothetical protein
VEFVRNGRTGGAMLNYDRLGDDAR